MVPVWDNILRSVRNVAGGVSLACVGGKVVGNVSFFRVCSRECIGRYCVSSDL